MTTIAQRAYSTATYSTVGATKSIVIPPAVQAGDLLLLGFSGLGAPDAVPPGWTTVRSVTDGSSAGAVYSRVAQSGDAGDTVTVAASTSGKTSLVLVAYSGTSTTGPIGVSASAAEPADTATHACPSLTTTKSTWVMEFLALKDGFTAPSSTYTPPSGFTTFAQASPGGTSTSVAVWADSGADKTAGTYTGTWTVDASSNNAVMIAVAVEPISTTTTVRPTADITTGSSTTAPAGQPLYTVLADDDPTTYVESPAGGTTIEVQLGSLSAAPNVVSVSGYAAGGATTQSVTTLLVQGTTVIATWGPETTLVTADHEYRYTLTAGQKAAVTDPTNLRIRQTTVMA